MCYPSSGLPDDAAFTDIKRAAPWFPVPELARLLPKLDLVQAQAAAWPPKPKGRPRDTIRVRQLPIPDTKQPEPPSALAAAVALAGTQFLLPHQPGSIFRVPTQLTMRVSLGVSAPQDKYTTYDVVKLLPYLFLEPVPEGGSEGDRASRGNDAGQANDLKGPPADRMIHHALVMKEKKP